MTGFQQSLLEWYFAHRRELPWRLAQHDPYAVWVSEVMLQQTTVATTVPYFVRWMERFPTVEALATSDLDGALALWQGLGYYRRCKMLHEAARQVVADGWPTSLAGWLKLPGVGAYTAAAVGSIAFGLKAAVVDGNVERVYARMCACGLPPAGLKGSAQKWASEVLFTDDPGSWNQAVMELGATVCTPLAPKCDQCPVSQWCVALSQGSVGQYPAPKPRKDWVPVQASVWLPVCGGRVGIRRVPAGRWWEGMWEFPREEDEASMVALFPRCHAEPVGSVRHVVTHHRVSVRVSVVRLQQEQAWLTWVAPQSIGDYAMPSVCKKILAMAQI